MTTYTTKGYMRLVDGGYWLSFDGPMTDEKIREYWLREKRHLEGRLRRVNQELEALDNPKASTKDAQS